MTITEEKNSKRRARYTIRDIAKMAGVSRSTVSLALNDSPRMNSKTKQEVLALIERVGYRPNQTARNLVSQSSGTFIVVLPKIDHVFSDFYFSVSLSGIIDELSIHGFHLMVEISTDDFRHNRKAIQLYRQGTVDGVLSIGNLTTDTYLAELAEAGCPVVLVNSSIPGLPQVLANNMDAAYRATRHLYDLGHRRIAHIRGSELVTTAAHRTAGYMRACTELALDCSPELIAEGNFDIRSGYLATKWLMSHKKRPTAIFTTNDTMAIGAIEACGELGLRVPEDIAIFGGDDIVLAQYVRPSLSTMRQSMFSIGKCACEQLLLRLEGSALPEITEVEMSLVIRESCGGSGGSQVAPKAELQRKALVS
jgi:DNA-binding LacI/PurR family transcriptional regulator